MKAMAYPATAVALLLFLMMIPIPVVEAASEAPNRHAIITVSYSSSRTPLEEERVEGEIELELYEKRAPTTTKNFIDLAEAGFFDGIIFHRIIDDFVIQSGDPNSRPGPTNTPLDWVDDGEGGSAETIPLESDPELKHHDGAISMARPLGDPDGANSQFFICDGAQYGLDDTEENNAERTYRYIDDRGYAVFGLTVRGIEVVREIASVWTDTDSEIETPDPLPTAQLHVHDHPIYDPIIESVEIITPPWSKVKQAAANYLWPLLGLAAIIGIAAVGAFLWFRTTTKSERNEADLSDLPKAVDDS